jgi:hypothetical protein
MSDLRNPLPACRLSDRAEVLACPRCGREVCIPADFVLDVSQPCPSEKRRPRRSERGHIDLASGRWVTDVVRDDPSEPWRPADGRQAFRSSR